MVGFQGRKQGAVLAYSISKLMAVTGSAALGVALCLGLPWLASTAGLAPHFPTPGGEDDFGYRAAWFMLGLCPAFALLGGWIGHAAFGAWRGWLAMWLGALAGLVIALAITFLLRSKIEAMTGQEAANNAVLAFYAALVTLAGLGAWLGRNRWRSAGQHIT